MSDRTTAEAHQPPLQWEDLLAVEFTDRSSLSTVVYDRDGRLVHSNPAFTRMWGVGIEDAPPDYTVFEDPELLRSGVMPIIRRAFEGEAVVTPPVCYDIRRTAVTGSGRTVWSEGHLFPVLDRNGDVAFVVLTHVDITERRQTEQELRSALQEVEQLHRLTAELATVVTVEEVAQVVLERARPAFGAAGGMVNVVLDGRHEIANIGLVGFDGSDMREYERFPITVDTPSGHAMLKGAPIFVKCLEAARRHYPSILRPLEENGFQSIATLPLMAHGRPFGTVSFLFHERMEFDARLRESMIAFAGQGGIALERARLYRAERDARVKAEAANREKAEFLASLAHELRTPLDAIDAYAELLEMELRGPLTDAQRADIVRIRHSHRHLLSVVDDVLSFARIEAGRVQLHPRLIGVDETIAGALDLILPLLEARQRRLIREPAGDQLHMYADPEKVRKILVNVLAITVQLSGSGDVRVSVRRTGDLIAIDIANAGFSIREDRLADVFEPFVPVAEPAPRRDRPIGLGLAIARDLARQMHGDIVVSAMPAGGSVFTLTVPAAP